ncbi:hypothetical protein JNW90_35140 [Micromonospora sp. STR1s_5]|nr:hypothetical protein [Micromonospora sp. STR1s_5]
MLDVEFAKQKVGSVLAQIQQLKSSEFPYAEPDAALDLLRAIYEAELTRLNSIDATTDPRIRQQACAQANVQVATYYDVLGFILRSTNVRNAFETYDPLLALCKRVYGSEAKLILSSEWAFSPFTYPAVVRDLPDLMFIGLPSTEASNSLIVPLAGHEIGHSVWRKPSRSPALASLDRALQDALTQNYHANWPDFQRIFKVKDPKEDLLSTLFLRGIWTQSYKLAARQTEELFCDILGSRLFSEGFLYSFIYLISPNLGERPANYPSLSARIKALSAASVAFGVPMPHNFAGYFSDPPKQLSQPEAFVLRMADSASDQMIGDLVKAVKDIAPDGPYLPSDRERDRILRHFCSLSPAMGAKSLGDIINAGWQIRLDWTKWSQFEFSPAVQDAVLNDLVFKTMEVMEFEARTASNA